MYSITLGYQGFLDNKYPVLNMKLTPFLMLLSTFLALNAYSQDASRVSEEEIYDFVNALAPFERSRLVYKAIDIKYCMDVDSLFKRLQVHFTKEDIDFMRKQVINNVDFTWDKRAKKIKLIKKNSCLKNIFYRGEVYTYSVPLFSIDRTMAIFCEMSHGAGIHSMSHTISVYLKVEGKWKHSFYILWIMS